MIHAPCVVLPFCALLAVTLSAKSSTNNRETVDADFGWKFQAGDPSRAENRTFDDGSWRVVDVPHDWSIEGRPDPKNATGSGGGYFPTGVGWYRKTFDAPKR